MTDDARGRRTERRSRRTENLGSFLGLWVAVVALAAWTRSPSPWWLTLAAGGSVFFLLRGKHTLFEGVWAIPVVAAVILGFAGHGRLNRLAGGWEEARRSHEESVGAELTSRMDALIDAGDRAVERLGGTPALEVADLAGIRREEGLDALAVYGPDGRLRAWDGSHRGRVPEAARLGVEPYVYSDRPLFGYLYFTSSLGEDGGVAVAASLLRADLPPGAEAGAKDFASRFHAATGERIRISRAERAAGSIWDLRWEGETLLSISLESPSQAERLDRVRLHWARGVAAFLLAAAFLMGLGLRRRPGEAWAAALAFLAVGALLPLGWLLGIRELYSPADFLLPGPLNLNLGLLFGVGLAGAVVVGMVRPALSTGAPMLGGLLMGVGAPLLSGLLRSGPSTPFLVGTDGEWIAYQGLLALGLSLLAWVALFLAWRPREEGRTRSRHLLGALALSVALALLLSARVEVESQAPAWAAALWALPVVWLGFAGPTPAGAFRRELLLWSVAIALGTSAALPFAWGDRLEARMSTAEEELQRLGVRPDPYLEFLLHRQTREMKGLESEGAGPVEVLYRGWVESRLAREGYPVWLTYWSPDGHPVEEFRVGVHGELSGAVTDALERLRPLGRDTVLRLDRSDAQYLSVSRLPTGSTVTAVVPPRRALSLGPPLGALFRPERAARPGVTLVPLDGEGTEGSHDVEWIRIGEGRRVETRLTLPDGEYRAQVDLDLPGPYLEAARAVLLLALDGAVLLCLWALGRAMILAAPPKPSTLASLAGSFRARLTLTLFGFFLIPTLAFGTLAYRTLNAASFRTASTLAERAVDEGADRLREEGGAVGLSARAVDGQLLLYGNGELVAGAPGELVDLGLYQGWLPQGARSELTGHGSLVTTVRESLGGWDYVVAYRRLEGERVLASPAPVQAGATALRRGEVTDLLAFAILVGAGLSVALSLLAGRGLYRPIQTLRAASERVGRGHLELRLPEERNDEFGSVFTAFNRMVGRLRRARRDLVRSTRRTEAIVEEAATGVVALDPRGRVTLKNPRAEDLLGVTLEAGRKLPEKEGPAGDLARWVALYFRDGLKEAGRELQVEDRRIRVRARRIARGGGAEGAVLSLEDVTDELRSERILAWGEMARQVAHEVKNPLTPIQLGIQHIRRAWEDRREDFGAILESNVETILREIDRLAAIARSFSRFGAPPAAGEMPLQAVSPYSVVEEVLALYETGRGTIRFENRVPRETPLVLSREPELKEVLINLLENAREAVSEGGRVQLEVEELADGVELRVRDDGRGIPEQILPRVFEPHFSTRSTGTGLGLAIVRRLVESWGGSVRAESSGRGAVVHISLQRASERAPGGEEGGTPDAENP